MKNRALVSAAALACVAGLAQAQSFSEGFEGVVPPWIVHNQSNPIGTTQWGVGASTVVIPHTGSFAIYANYLNGANLATLSDWLILPALSLQNGDTLQFWTRTTDGTFPDRLQVRMASIDSTNTGTTETDLGDFTTLLLDINPTYSHTGYPVAWQQYTITLSGLPGTGVTGRFAFRYFVEGGGPSGANSDLIGVDDVAYTSVSEPTGACCLNDGTCQVLPQGACTGLGGTIHIGQTCLQANCPPPATGRCCALDGTCTTVTQAACSAIVGAIWGGANSTCGACPQPWHETTDAGELPASAQAVTGSGSVSAIFGHTDGIDTDMYEINICDHAAFSASTTAAATGDTLDTQLFLFDANGLGVTMDDDSAGGVGGSLITGQFVPSNGTYYLAYSLYNRDPVDSAAALIWNNTNNGGAFTPEWQPNGPAAANPVASWTGTSAITGDYIIALQGVCFIQSCYANCDGSTGTPALNANDFQCFLNAFAVASGLPNAQQITSYANCDGSTGTPALNANDFQCFLNAFAAGCS